MYLKAMSDWSFSKLKFNKNNSYPWYDTAEEDITHTHVVDLFRRAIIFHFHNSSNWVFFIYYSMNI